VGEDVTKLEFRRLIV